MNITFRCPDCERTSREPLVAELPVACPQCDWKQSSAARMSADEKVDECFVCGCKELFIRKNFSQRLGVAVVVLAATSSLIAWYYYMWYTAYGILFAAALLDLYLYFKVGNLLQCYRCNAEYRGLPHLDDHEAFSLETHEKYRQQAIRLAQEQKKESQSV